MLDFSKVFRGVLDCAGLLHDGASAHVVLFFRRVRRLAIDSRGLMHSINVPLRGQLLIDLSVVSRLSIGWVTDLGLRPIAATTSTTRFLLTLLGCLDLLAGDGALVHVEVAELVRRGVPHGPIAQHEGVPLVVICHLELRFCHFAFFSWA